MNTAEGRASEVLEVNFFDGIILPRATPAWSGVMHSMSSMPRHSSHSLTCFQSFTPRKFLHRRVRGCVPRDQRGGLPFLRAASITKMGCNS